MRYTVLMDRNTNGSYTVTVPALEGCVSQGDRWDEALKNVEEAIAGYIETLRLLKKPVPVEVEVTVDKEADALYMRISDTRIHESEEVKPGIILDYDDQNNLVGVEILRVSERVPSASLRTVMIESA